MKANNYLLLLGLFFALAACNNEETNEPAIIDVDSEAAIDEAFEEVDVITEAGMTLENSNGREEDEDEALACSSITRDTDNKTITVDFGDGCEGPGGRVRSGKMIITYSDRRYVPGATRSITFDNFFIDGVQIEGTRTMTNISESLDDNPKFNTVLVGGRVTFEDGTFATREANHTRTWIRSGSPINDESVIEGTANGVDRNGVPYSINISAPLIFKRSCQSARNFVPVSGVQDMVKGENTAAIDYGDGTCDNLVTITVNGVSTEREIKGLRIGRRG